MYEVISAEAHLLRERQESRFSHRNAGDRAMHIERLEARLDELWQDAYKRFRKGS